MTKEEWLDKTIPERSLLLDGLLEGILKTADPNTKRALEKQVIDIILFERDDYAQDW